MPRRRPVLPAALRRELLAHGALERRVAPADVGLMLAGTRSTPFSREGWLFEIKYDGFRALFAREKGRARLVYRGGGDATAAFPEIAAAASSLAGDDDVVLDGELVACDDQGRPRFQALQQRYRSSRGPAGPASTQAACRFYAFDALAAAGLDLRAAPLALRKDALGRIVPGNDAFRRVEHVETEGEALFAEVQRKGLEGMVAKRAGSRYTPGRSHEWLKVRIEQQGEFVIVGFTRPELGRQGGLHLASLEPEGLRYAGRVGTGFEPGVMDELRVVLAQFRTPLRASLGVWPRGRDHTWVEPRIRCEVRYKERTDEGLLRHPVFVRFLSGPAG
jgi:bifunctional non-homologous end joining protein LigD